jgi:hypothetical protein
VPSALSSACVSFRESLPPFLPSAGFGPPIPQLLTFPPILIGLDPSGAETTLDKVRQFPARRFQLRDMSGRTPKTGKSRDKRVTFSPLFNSSVECRASGWITPGGEECP